MRESIVRKLALVSLVLGVLALLDATVVKTALGLDKIPAAAWHQPIDEIPCRHPGRSKVNPSSYKTVDDGPVLGSAFPLGGIGAGTIRRSYSGSFAAWHLYQSPTDHRAEVVDANQLSLAVCRTGEPRCQAVVLNGDRQTGKALEAWRWGEIKGQFHGLFPLAWTEYLHAGLDVQVKQFSPVIPANYRESSYPVALFKVTLRNTGSKRVRAGVMLSWENMSQWFSDSTTQWKHSSGSRNLPFEQGLPDGTGTVKGLHLATSRDAQSPGGLAIAALGSDHVTVTSRDCFDPTGDGRALWEDFEQDGTLNPQPCGNSNTASDGRVAGAVVATTEVPEQGEAVLWLALTWDFPEVRLGKPTPTTWFRRYTEWFGRSGDKAPDIAVTALRSGPSWETAIAAFQTQYTEDARLPEWLTRLAMNELYYIVDGGILWATPPRAVGPGISGGPDAPPRGLTVLPGTYKFLMSECYDYRYFETLDVRYYYFPLVLFWPELERQVLLDFAGSLEVEDLETRTIGFDKSQAPRKLEGAAPHDLGGPDSGPGPYARVNAFDWQDANQWRTLASQMVLQFWRYIVLARPEDKVQFSRQVVGAVRYGLEYTRRWDHDGDGLVEHSETTPDTTYDVVVFGGPAAYSASLLVAALDAGERIARLAGEPELADSYGEWRRKARQNLETKLWGGSSFIKDVAHPDVCMADQLSGQWYAFLLGLEPVVADTGKITTALKSVFARNVEGFAEGTMGAVNEVFGSSGQVNTGSEQSQEVWTGSTLGLASLMVAWGLKDEGLRAAKGIHDVLFARTDPGRCLAYRTPEAWDEAGDFRAAMYMRPGAVWGVVLALTTSEKRE